MWVNVSQLKAGDEILLQGRIIMIEKIETIRGEVWLEYRVETLVGFMTERGKFSSPDKQVFLIGILHEG